MHLNSRRFQLAARMQRTGTTSGVALVEVKALVRLVNAYSDRFRDNDLTLRGNAFLTGYTFNRSRGDVSVKPMSAKRDRLQMIEVRRSGALNDRLYIITCTGTMSLRYITTVQSRSILQKINGAHFCAKNSTKRSTFFKLSKSRHLFRENHNIIL